MVGRRGHVVRYGSFASNVLRDLCFTFDVGTSANTRTEHMNCTLLPSFLYSVPAAPPPISVTREKASPQPNPTLLTAIERGGIEIHGPVGALRSAGLMFLSTLPQEKA